LGGPRNKPGQLRIIGGDWRSRRIAFDAAAGVRPTPDRVRETLFNWLREVVPGARCLDLFAGSGALGFEALSRGAGLTVFVDEDIRVVQQLQANITLLKAAHAIVAWSDAFAYLASCEQGPFDIVFLDPPFRDRILGECAVRLERRRLLAPVAWIYMEADRNDPPPELPDNWRVFREQDAGQVAYRLCRRSPPS
jgi:16S rRNA (guanine966-N2)-methyltransferase